MNALLDHLKTRRSALSLTLEAPGPDEAQIRTMVEIASRVPDHGKLAPWRFEVWSKPLRETMHAALVDMLDGHEDVPDKAKLIKGTDKLLHAPCVIAVISQPQGDSKIPIWEQTLSAGAACMNLLHAANAKEYEAQWLTAWYVYDRAAQSGLGLSGEEQIAGIVHIGSSQIPKSERPRPDLDSVLSFRSE